MEIKRGDIFYVKPGNYVATGSEQTGNRPAVIIQNDVGNMHSPTVIVGYLTAQEKKEYPMHAEIMCKIPSTFLGEQIFTVSRERIGEYIRSCTEKEMQAVNEALAVSLDLQGVGMVAFGNCEECQTVRDYEDAEQEWIKRSEELASRIEELEMKNEALLAALQEAESKSGFYKQFYEDIFRSGKKIEIKVG